MAKTQSTHTFNGIGHFDIAGPDIAALKQFYSAVFDWQIDSRGPGYAAVTTPGDSPNGALVESEEAALTVGVVVADLDKALETGSKQGGKVVTPVTDNGWVKKAQMSDPAGNLVTLIQG
jgi:predicted enzyme related to lactoylglutathione lyase